MRLYYIEVSVRIPCLYNSIIYSPPVVDRRTDHVEKCVVPEKKKNIYSFELPRRGVAGDLGSNRGRCSARNRRDHAPPRFKSSPGPPSIYFTSLITRNAKVLTRSTRTATTASTRGRYLFRMHLTVKTVRSRCLINGLCS